MQTKPVHVLVEKFASDLEVLMQEELRAQTRSALESVLGEGNGGSSTPPKRRGTASPASVLHGRYIGNLHSFKGAQRERIKKLRAKEGAAAAIKLMKKLQSS